MPRVGVRDAHGRPRDLADPPGQPPVTRGRGAPRNTMWKDVIWGTENPQTHLVYRADRPAEAPSTPEELAEPRGDRGADRAVSVRLEVDPVDRARRDVVAQIQERDGESLLVVAAAADRRTPGSAAGTRPRRRETRPGPLVEGRERGRDDHQHHRVHRRRDRRRSTGRPRRASSPRARVVSVHTRQEQIVRAQVDDDDIERMMRQQGDGQMRQPVAVRLERHVEHGGATVLPSSITSISSPSARCSTPGHRSHRPRRSVRRGLVAPRVGIAVTQDRGHATRRCRSVRSRRVHGPVLRADGPSRSPPPRHSPRCTCAEDRVLAVQPRRLADRDEELRAVRVRTGVRHGEAARPG